MMMFLVALTSTSDRPPIAQQPTELAALALFGVSVICMSVVLVPWFRWHFYARPGVVRRQIERGLTASEIRDQRARKIPKDLAKDQGRIVLLQWIFIFGIGAFIAEVICWVCEASSSQSRVTDGCREGWESPSPVLGTSVSTTGTNGLGGRLSRPKKLTSGRSIRSALRSTTRKPFARQYAEGSWWRRAASFPNGLQPRRHRCWP